ncbi:hypothetical protein CEP54_014690 [Fusarium duplospermum]|uniref:Uncharacterized protein n=1 Tax=Fusarium duplospermum TaxID=1325734 RepID=A0A428NUF4_9HYPO|nr:hypothetical protein CEP54_014690 [Fusarium duplospermum]
MPTPRYNLTPEERRIFDLACTPGAWEQISREDKDAILDLDAKYPDIVKTSVPTPGGSVASSSLPLSQMSELPETPSQLSRPRLWEAYHKTQDIWKGQLAEPPPVPLPHPGIARGSMWAQPGPPGQFFLTSSPPAGQSTSMVQPPMSPYPREAQPAPPPSQFYLTSSPAAAEASAPVSPSSPGYRRPPPPAPLSPYPHEQASAAPATHSQRGPTSVPGGPSQQRPPVTSQKPPSHETEKIQLLKRIADRRAWVTRKRDESVERYRASLHDAVDAETDVTKLTNELQELAIQEQQIRDSMHLAQETPKTSSAKRRERKKRAQEKQGSFDNGEDDYDDF